jgi:hypothetical protein
MDAAAIPIGELPDPLLSPQGLIDSVDAYASSEPGLTPLAQARNPLSSWMAAVDRLGPLTPLCDPLFVGTAFPLADAVSGLARPPSWGGEPRVGSQAHAQCASCRPAWAARCVAGPD